MINWRYIFHIGPLAVILMLTVLMLAVSSVEAQVDVVVRVDRDSPIDQLVQGQFGKAQISDSLLGDLVSWKRLIDRSPVNLSIHRSLIVSYPDSVTADSAIRQISVQESVRSAEFSFRFQIDQAVDDPHADSSAFHSLVEVPRAWAISDGERSVRVGLVDTGLYFDHPEFAGQIWINSSEDINGDGEYSESDLDGIDNDGNGWVDDIRGFDFVNRADLLELGDFRERDSDPTDDGSGHGTNVAGIVAAARNNGRGAAGVAPGVSIVPLRAFASDGIGSDIDIATAIIYAADMGFDVLNLSFGDVYESSLMREAIAYAISVGTIVVASGGNSGGDSPHYPSDYTDVISVVWLNSDGSGPASRATHGVGIDIGAPGSQIYTTLQPFGEDQQSDSVLFGRRSGSSMAAPMVTGAVALLRSVDADLSPQAVRDILTATATDLNDPGWDDETASGRLNIFGALTNILPSRIVFESPENNRGYAESIPVVASILHPDLSSWNVDLILGDSELNGQTWIPIDSGQSQSYLDTLATYDVESLAEGLYTIRLLATLKDGRSVEDRRRIYVDRSPPLVTIRHVGPALIGNRVGVFADLESSDLSRVTMEVQGDRVESDKLSRIHGLHWVDASTNGGEIVARISVENTAGLVTRIDTVIALEPVRLNSGLLSSTDLDVPAGYLLQQLTDFDSDGLREIVFNQYVDGWIGDTLVIAEYNGTDFVPAAALIANVFPRDIGDTDGDGLTELLTQVGPSTLILEQTAPNGYPLNAILVDTISTSNPTSGQAVWAAALIDIDDDGSDELLSHNTSAIRIHQATSGILTSILELPNPTAVSNSQLAENTFEQPSILEGDFDNDGLQNYLIGDGDGDLLLFEQDGSGSVSLVWTFETDRYSSATRYGKGDFDGDGVEEFVTYSRNWLAATSENEREPDAGVYYFWTSTGDNEYSLEYTFAVPGTIDRHSSIAAVDIDMDGDDELVLLDSPDLFVLDRSVLGSWVPVYHEGAESGAGPRSATMVAGSLDGSGQESIVLADLNGSFRILTPSADAFNLRVPDWLSADPLGEDAIALAWNAPGADSVTVYSSTEGMPFGKRAVVIGSAYVDSTTVETFYSLQGWHSGTPSGLSRVESAYPHAPAMVNQIDYPSYQTIKIRFTEKLDSDTQASQFLYTDGAARSLVFADGGFAIVLRFDLAAVANISQIQFSSVKDVYGLTLGVSSIDVGFPINNGPFLILSDWEVELPNVVTLQFNLPVQTVPQPGASNFLIEPFGTIESVEVDPLDTKTITVALNGVNLSAGGQNPLLTVVDLRSSSGLSLAPEGNSVKLAVSAINLDNAFVFPNPVDTKMHTPRVQIAAIPEDTSVSILSIDGVLINRFPTTDHAGEIAWDLRDKNGVLVPSGVYLLRLQHNSGDEVFKKLVVVR